MPEISFTAPPTVARFMQSDAFFRLIAGPVGSGKTTGAIFEILRRAIEQEPGEDGVRYTRFAIVRQTLKQLEDTVLKDIEFWLRGLVEYKVSKRTIYIRFGDVDSEWLLIPLEDEEDQKRLLSSQLTGAWMSECIEIDVKLVPALLGRCGRFPSGRQGKPTWFGVIGDTNMPTEGSEWHKLMALETPMDWTVFIQPSGLAPDAENIENLPGGRQYYERLARTPNPAWVKRYVEAQFGEDPSGQAVFRSSFKPSFHCTAIDDEEGLTPTPGMPLMLAMDLGRNPCSLLTQVDHRGRLLVLQEFVIEDLGLEAALQQVIRPALMSERYAGFPVYVVGDPSGIARNSIYEVTSFDIIKGAGFPAYPAPTNDLDKRLRAVEGMMLQQRDGGPALLIDRQRCPSLVVALNGRYRYAKRRSGQLAPSPEKSHPWSDLADALQYSCLVAHGGLSGYVAERLQLIKRSRERKPAPSRLAWT